METKTKFRFAVMPFALAGIIAPMVTACGDELGANPLCCGEGDFQVGGTVTASGQAGVALQAVADVAGIGSAAIDDLTTACRAIATDLEAPEADRKAADANTDKRAKAEAWCNVAVSAIGTFKAQAGGTLSIVIQEPKCSASVSAKANCQAKCSGSAECDIKANPPTCEGGKLEVACKGSCTAMGSAEVGCTGSCEGGCTGECTAEGGVECEGKCEGTCAAGGMAGGTGIQADGRCEGICSGTCKATPPKVDCSGSCKGTCDAACKATADVAVKCDGACDADFEPLKCEGGELKGGCKVEAKCDANCDASASAKLECTPPSIAIAFSGAADIQAAGKLKAVLEANLGLVASLEARVNAAGTAVVTLSGNITADVLADVKVACIPVVAAAAAGAVEDFAASGSLTVKVMGSVGGG